MKEQQTTGRTSVFRLGGPNNGFTAKSEIAEEYCISRRTLTRYLKKLEDRLPDYDRNQRLLSPRQMEELRGLLG